MGMIRRMATLSAEDRQMHDGTPYKGSDYMQKISFILLARHGHAECIICMNDPYDTSYTRKDDERDLRVQGTPHLPNTYMKLSEAFPSAGAFRTLLCSVSNKGRLQNMIRTYLTDLAQSVDAEGDGSEEEEDEEGDCEFWFKG